MPLSVFPMSTVQQKLNHTSSSKATNEITTFVINKILAQHFSCHPFSQY